MLVRIIPGAYRIFGYSAGGFTALVAIGGSPDLSRAAAFCREHAQDWGCAAALLRAEHDGIVVDEWNTAPLLAALPVRPELHVVGIADHFAFLAPCGDSLAQRAR